MTTHALTRLSSTRFLVVRSIRLQRELLRDPSADCCARGDDRSLDEQGGCVCGVRGRDNGQREVVEREGGGRQRETERERETERQRESTCVWCVCCSPITPFAVCELYPVPSALAHHEATYHLQSSALKASVITLTLSTR